MRTSIVVDDDLFDEAFKYSGDVQTKRELVEIALKEYVFRHKMKNLRNLRGKISFEEGYDYREMRNQR